MESQRRPKNKLLNYIVIIILCIGMCYAYEWYQINNFNNFKRSESNLYTSEFKRDKTVKYSENRSYKITSKEYNDAMFSETIKVNKNTPYKVTCMVKTNGVQSKDIKTDCGAHISISDSTEKSISVTGTQDWEKIELIFNSKNREEVNVGFRLGGYAGDAKGEAWFSDFAIEEGIAEENNNWKFACFTFRTTDVNVDGKEVKLEVTDLDLKDIQNTVKRFEDSCVALSEGKMTAQCDIYEIDEPITTLSYDEEFAYYVAPEDIEKQIQDKIAGNDYDHIFIIFRLGDSEHLNDIQVNDWIGLGGMDYYGMGYSNIRLPNDSKSYIYKYDLRVNTFPEEVLLHEFLHSLERTAVEYGYEVPDLHSYEEYGYKNETVTGQKRWYTDYMNKEITTSEGNVGLPEEVYTLKPPKSTNFKYSYQIKEYFQQPDNFIEEIKEIFNHMGKNVKNIFE